MITLNSKLRLIFVMVSIALLSSLFGFSQKRYPDGTVVYPDGRKVLANGTIIRGGIVIGKQAPGTVILPAPRTTSTVLLPPQRRYHSQGWIPPGQAKKMYGTKSAKPFAPGQQKKWQNGQGNDKGKWKKSGRRDRD